MSFHNVTYQPTRVDTIGNDQVRDIDTAVETAVIAVANTVNDRPLFSTPEGRAMLFYIPPKESYRLRYKQLILENGGIITDVDPSEAPSKATKEIIYLSRYPIEGKSGVLLQYIDQCIESGQLLDIQPFEFEGMVVTGGQYFGRARVASEVGRSKSSRGHSKFTPEKDAFILKKIRLNPRLRNSHRFFDDLANEEELRGHTGNSIRSRYRKHLEKDLKYVYDVDENGRVLHNHEGKKIKRGVDDLPDTLKNKYVAAEDYTMCVEAKIVLPNLENDNQWDQKLPYSFFSHMNRKCPKHSLHSWRDHYRKYAFKGIHEYIKYYENSIANGTDPLPLSLYKNRTSKGTETHALIEASNQLRDSVGASYRRQNYQDMGAYGESPLDEEIGESKSSNIDHALVNNTHHKSIAPPKLDELEDSDDSDDSERSQTLHNARVVGLKRDAPNADELDEGYSTAQEDESLAAQLSHNVLAELEREASPPVNIHESPERKRQKNNGLVQAESYQDSQLDSQTQYRTPAGSQLLEEEPPKETQEESQVSIQYLDDSFTLGDLFYERAYAHFNDPRTLINDMTRIVKSSESIPDLFEEFKQLGFKEKFVSHAVMSTSADVAVMSSFLGTFVEKLVDAVSTNDTSELLEPIEFSGVWNRHQDSLLGTDKEEELLNDHSRKQLIVRKEFLEKI